jgi:hypothetical protein
VRAHVNDEGDAFTVLAEVLPAKRGSGWFKTLMSAHGARGRRWFDGFPKALRHLPPSPDAPPRD